MARNPYFTNGTGNEQNIIEDIIVESLGIYGQDFFYIPRTLVSKDEILGEDRLSLFKDAYPIEMYLENVDGFEGQGAFIQKFGLMMEQTATLTVARRTWTNLVGVHGTTIIPTRPCEGDLLYFPLTKGMFEIKFVQHQDPFYQLGKLYVYKLQVELFQYASERIDTGISNVDVFETLKTFSTDTTRNNTAGIVKITMTNNGLGYTHEPIIEFTSTTGSGAAAIAIMGTGLQEGQVVGADILDAGTGYATPPIISFVGGDGEGAEAVAEIVINIDIPDSFGDNNKFKEQVSDILFNESNPFGDVVHTHKFIPSDRADTTSITADTTKISADKE